MSYPHLHMSANPHDRAGVRRADDAWLEKRWADPDSRVLVVSGTRIRPAEGRLDWVRPGEAPEGLRLLLGESEGHARFAVIIDPSDAPGDPEEWVPLRNVLPALAQGLADQAPQVFHAIGLAEWHHATRFCPRCGEGLESRSAGHELVCRGCGRSQFPRTDPAVIMAVVHGEGADQEILLGRQKVWPEGRWSTLAGFLEPGETLEDAVRREVAEEVGVVVDEVDYFGNQPWPLPASLMLGFVAHARSRELHVDGVEIEDARWFSRDLLRSEIEAGRVVIPQGVSISYSLLRHWYGGPLPGAGW